MTRDGLLLSLARCFQGDDHTSLLCPVSTYWCASAICPAMIFWLPSLQSRPLAQSLSARRSRDESYAGRALQAWI
jgi:hypothetical protein